MLLRTLGALELLAPGPDGDPVRVMGPQKPLALVAYLALSRGRRSTREELSDLLWGDLEPARARQGLRQVLWMLRTRLGDEALLTHDDTITLSIPLRVDCVEFEGAVARGALSEAWASYTGPFIPDFAGPGSAEFERWCDGQRERYRAAWLVTGEALVREHLAQARPAAAAEVARRMRDDSPDRLDAWRALIHALLSTGRRMEATAEARALEAHARVAELAIDASTRDLLARVAREPAEASGASTSARPRPELVGRERPFSVLLRTWSLVQASGRGATCVLRGSAGIGKSRLLEALQARLEADGGAVVALRARAADREVPYSFAASLAESLACLPGAVGVSPAVAGILVDLAPSLSNTFRGTRAPRGDAGELSRVRTLALVELLGVVAEEAPLALLVDDLHWMDEASRQLLASIGDRLGASAAMLVVALRPAGVSWSAPRGTTWLDLPALTEEHVGALLGSMASGDGALLAELGRMLHETTGGEPLLVLAAIELAIEQRVLAIDEGRWACPNVGGLRRVLGEGGVIEKLLAELPEAGRLAMVVLALAGGPLDDEVVGAATGRGDAGAGVLAELELRGMVLRSGVAWELAHDRLADAALAVVPNEPRRDASLRGGRALLAARDPGVRRLQSAGRLLMEGSEAEGARCFVRWLERSRDARLWRDPSSAAAAFLGEASTSTRVRELSRRVPRAARIVRGYPWVPRAAGALGVVGVVLGIGLGVAGAWEPSPRAMVLQEPETSNGFLFPVPTERDASEYPVPLSVTLVDERGKPTRNAPRWAEVRLVRERGNIRLSGTTRRSFDQGRAWFPDLVAVGGGVFHLEVRAGGLPVARTGEMLMPGTGPGGNVAQVLITGGMLNGQPLDSARRAVRVRPGALLHGSIDFRVTTAFPTAAVVLGAVALWGDRRTNWMTLTGIPSHGVTTWSLPLEDHAALRKFRAPSAPGRYRVVFLADAETEMRFTASGTNWTVGTPRWFDGDDIADFGERELRMLDSRGVVFWRRTKLENGTTRVIRAFSELIGTTIEVIVEPAPRAGGTP